MINHHGTRSSRDIKSSMGFNELLNQLDKEVSQQQPIQQIGSNQQLKHQNSNKHKQQQKQQQQQQQQFMDFKNMTAHDLLKLEISGIRRQNSSGTNFQQQNLIGSKSQERVKPSKKSFNLKQQTSKDNSQNKQQKSQENKRSLVTNQNQKINGTTNIVGMNSKLPKPILKKNSDYVIKDQVFQYNNNNNANLLNITPDKNQNHQGVNTNSYLHSEHGRCTTSQGQNNNTTQSLNFQNNVKSLGQQAANINVLFSKIKVQNKNQNSNSKKRSKINVIQKNNSASPDRNNNMSYGNATSSSFVVKDFKTIANNNNSMSGLGGIDKLVRENIRRIKSKEDEEKMIKIQNEDQKKKKKVQQDLKNEQVRKINKEKTYKKNTNNINNNSNFQQSQDFRLLLQHENKSGNINAVGDLQKILLSKNNIISNRDKQIQKQSQSQKIDFQKIIFKDNKGSGTQAIGNNNLNKINNSNSRLNINISRNHHRKSYGLEFIDIKREIQDELKTIDLKFKNNLNENKILEESSTFNAEDFVQFKPKRLKVKSQKKIQVLNQHQKEKDDTLPLNSGADQFISERVQPLSKIIVVKKNKIRKFMKMKKKNIIIQKIKEQKEEIIKTIKMQENISKLNDFCKKKLEKQQQQKKKNTTMRVVNGNLTGNMDDNFNNKQLTHTNVDRNEISRISGRRIVFDNIINNYNNRTINHQTEDGGLEINNKDDSSRLSTEFYEEYFRLINSIKKEQQLQKQENLSRMNLSTNQNLTSQSCNNLLKSPGMNKSQSPQRLISNTQIIHISPSTKDKNSHKTAKSKSNTRGAAQDKQRHETSKGAGIPINNKVPLGKSNYKLKELQSQQNHNNRAESAPLIVNIQNSQKKRQKTTSPDKDKKSRKKQKKQDIVKIPQGLNQDQIIYEKILKIQRAIRFYLYRKGFYNLQRDEDEENLQSDQDHSLQTVQQNHDSSQSQFQTQIYDGNKLDSLNEQLNDQDIDQFDLNIEQQLHDTSSEIINKNQIKQTNQKEDYHNDDGQQSDDLQDEDDELDHDEDDEELEEDEEQDHQNLIIINQQSNDDKKVVYMSNIDSFSLPQTPRIDDQISNLKQDQVSISNLKKVFEYKPGNMLEQNEFFSEPLSEQDLIHQSISQKPSIESQIDKSIDDKFSQNLIQKDNRSQNNENKIAKDAQNEEEIKKADYTLRLFTGSESLLRELKLSTPKQQSQSSHKKYDLLSNDDQKTSNVKKQTNSHYSVKSQQRIPQLNLALDSQSNKQNANNSKITQLSVKNINDQNSHSSQSLFERNSFQQFTMSKMKEIMKNNEYMNIIEMREKALQYRQVKENKFIKKMLKNNQMSPRTYISKKEQLEKWVALEKEEIQKTKKQFQEEWQKTLQMIEDTQRNVDIMREKMKLQLDQNNNVHNHLQQSNNNNNNNNIISNNHTNNRLSSSQFNSNSSRNSSSSYATASKNGGAINAHNNNYIQRKSILEQEEYQPISQRSLIMSLGQPLSAKEQNSINYNNKLKEEIKEQQKQKEQQKLQDNENNLANNDGENLLDFLEKSWIKNQQKDNQTSYHSNQYKKQGYLSNKNDFMDYNEISDQKSSNQYQNNFQHRKSNEQEQNKKQNDKLYQEHYLSESDELMTSHRENQINDKNHDNILESFNNLGLILDNQNNNNIDEINNSKERQLTKSRSQQDLTDMIKKSKLNLNELDDIDLQTSIIKENNLQNQEYESKRDSQQEKQQRLNHQQNLLNLKDLYNHQKSTDQILNNDLVFENQKYDNRNLQSDIKIQENLFEDSSNRYSKGLNYYKDNEDKGDDDDDEDDEDEEQKFQSEDSLLNESELNNYFQDQKFSIEDFKSLDKRKILNHPNLDEDDESIDRNQSEIFVNQQDDSVNEQDRGINFQQKSQMTEMNDGNEPEPTFIDSQRLRDNGQISPELQPATFIQQNLLFNNAKPGENIKISDILRKSQILQDQQTNILNSQESSQLIFQNQQINQRMTTDIQPLNKVQNDILADQITNEIIKQLLSSEIQVPQRQFNENTQMMLHSWSQQYQQQINENENLGQQPIPEQASGGDVYIIDAITNEKEQRREIIDNRLRIIIEQDLMRVENYINEVIQALQQAELSYLTQLSMNPNQQFLEQMQNYHRQFLQVLTTPIKKSELDLLNQLQTSEIGSYDHFETAMDLTGNPILPIDLYLDIERQREENQIRMMGMNGFQDVDLENSVLQESIHIHNKAIFDSLNESLMKFRPYGIQGEPMPWSNKNRRLQTKVDTNSVDTERLFFMVKQDVLRWTQSFCGSQPSPVFVCKRDQQNNDQFDDELFQETRERRLAQILATEVVENEHQWLTYDFEEAQVKIDLSDMILEHLVEETAQFLNNKYQISIENE